VFAVEGFEDPPTEFLLELEEDLDAGKIDPAVAGEVADPEDPPDIVLGIERMFVGVRAGARKPSSS